MNMYYTDERNAQIVLSLLKAHGIKKIIASPGTTDICLVASLMHDNFFEIYSSAEERSAAYMACGLSAESGEPVVIICTGATASRNYLPALTEAYYRKLPILAITCSRRSYRVGHNIDQVTDRTQPPKDTVKLSVQVPLVYDYESEWYTVVTVNKAILELTHRGNGPVHINLETNYSTNYSVESLPETRVIKRIMPNDSFPELSGKKIAIFVGSHLPWSCELETAVDKFCECNNAFVICDHTSNYKGKYAIYGNITGQQTYTKTLFKSKLDLIIHIGDVHAPWYNLKADSVWRVNPDGELRDTFRKLRYVFEMSELEFFDNYNKSEKYNIELYREYKQEQEIGVKELNQIIDNLPFSNAWVAAKTEGKLPKNCELHLGIQNSLRFWNFFHVDNSINVFSNVGGFGIDGSLSSLIGASLCNPNKVFYCVLGDLAFFYDLNSLGNRHIGNNLRILLVNNGKGTEFKLEGNPGFLFGDKTDEFIAAGGHYGNQSRDLVKHYAKDLGFEYLSAETKDEYLSVVPAFLESEPKKSIVFEIFTDSSDENLALTMIRKCMASDKDLANAKMKQTVKKLIGDNNVKKIKNIIGK